MQLPVASWAPSVDGAPYLVGIIAVTGGAFTAFSIVALGQLAASASRIRAIQSRIQLSADLSASRRGGPVVSAPWIPRAVSSGFMRVGGGGVNRLARLLAGRYAAAVESRLRYEPAREAMANETWRLAGGMAGAVGVGALTLSLVVALTSGVQAALLPALLGVLSMIASSRYAWVLADRWLSTRSADATDELPILIDTVSLCTRAGMSFDHALELYSRRFDGHLSEMLEQAASLWRSGISSRAHELNRLSARLGSPPVERLFAAIIQSNELGTPLAAVLDAQASEVRAQRQSALEERVSKLPVKMLIPIGLFTLPAMLILLLAPVALQVIGGLA